MRVLAALALAAAGLSLSASASAAPAGEITHVSGAVMAQKPDGQSRILSVKSSVNEGDVLATSDNAYARVKFADGGEVVLRPSTQVKIDRFNFEEQKPQSDGMALSLLKGGLRAVTGLLGRRNPAAVRVATPSATIGIRGTTFNVLLVEPPAAQGGPRSEVEGLEDSAMMALKMIPEMGDLSAASESAMKSVPLSPKALIGFETTLRVAQRDADEPPATPAGGAPDAGLGVAGAVGLPIGLHVQVIDGVINLTNKGGSQSFSAGQFGYVASFARPPVIVPANPGIQFTPPPSFLAPSGLPGAGVGKAGALACTI
jgi:hypothetical protein